MTEQTIIKDIPKPDLLADLLVIEDHKDFLLRNLSFEQLEDFKKEIDIEIVMKKASIARYDRYHLEAQIKKRDLREKMEAELRILRKEFEDVGVYTKKKKQKKVEVSDNEEDEIEESEEVDIPIVKKHSKKSKTKK